MYKLVQQVAVATILWIMAFTTAWANQDNPVVLTVTVEDQVTEFDMPMLKALGVEAFETSTIWTDGVVSFEGVPLMALINYFEIETGVMTAKAINDYEIMMPVEEGLIAGPLIAYHMNGKEMSVRDKGPLWLVYPYDSDEAFQSEVVYARSIWQLDRISFGP